MLCNDLTGGDLRLELCMALTASERVELLQLTPRDDDGCSAVSTEEDAAAKKLQGGAPRLIEREP